MRVIVLGTGRCGTTTFVRACQHLTNYTAGHETRAHLIGPDRFAYPDQHVEADNRLSWFLGELGQRFPDAHYVHLLRDREEVARSYLNRWGTKSIIRPFGQAIVMHWEEWSERERLEVCRFYVDTVTANVDAFLEGRAFTTMWLHEARESFPAFLDRIGAEGDLPAAAAEWAIRHNRSAPLSAVDLVEFR